MNNINFDKFIQYYPLIKEIIISLFGGIFIYWLSKKTQKFFTKKISAQYGLVTSKLLLYLGFSLILISILNELGFKLTTLLGAAGVLGVAVGFASQTSISNIISGLFFITEQSFKVNDVISVGETTGIVMSIDMLSIKLRTFDNKLVRIPNEVLIKSEIVNVTRFPIRRIDIAIGIAYKENIKNVKNILLDIAKENPLCLSDPEPLVIVKGFGESSVDLQFMVWVEKINWIKVKSQVLEEVKRVFDEKSVEIPFPHMTIYTGAATKPFPLKVVDKK